MLLAMNKFLKKISLYICVLSFTNVVAKDNHIDSLQVVTENWWPYNYLLPNGEISGTSTDSVREILSQAGLKFEIQLYPWARAYSKAKSEANTIIYSIYRTPERENLFHWMCPINQIPQHNLYKLKLRNDIKVNSMKEVSNYAVAVTRDTFPHELLLSHGLHENRELLVTSSNEETIRMLLIGKVDMIIEVKGAMVQLLKDLELPISYVEPIYQVATNLAVQNCMALSLNSAPDVIEKVRKAHMAVISQRGWQTKHEPGK